jgi:glycosyltransferase involved in cell wall biosynthesis
MQEIRLRDALAARPSPGRVLYVNQWFRDHNNVRYAELLPRLGRIDALLLRTARARVPRGVQYRLWRGPAGDVGQRLLLRRAASGWSGFFTTHFPQLAWFPGPTVVDVDDTHFEPSHLALFRRPNIAALVTTTGWAAERLRKLGVSAPVEVVPQGVTFAGVTDEAVRAEAVRRDGGELVVAYTAAWLLAGDDPGAADPLSNVDHLLEVWDEVHARLPGARLWLVGQPRRELLRRAAGRDDIVLFGRVSRERVLPILMNADLAVYPRRKAAGLAVMKISSYLAAGLPVVSYDEPRVSAQLAPTGAGVVVDSPRELVAAVERLAADGAERGRLAEAARAAGRELDWDVLARRYETEILDRYLPR